MKPTPDIARLPFKRRYQRKVRQGRRDRYAGPVRAVSPHDAASSSIGRFIERLGRFTTSLTAGASANPREKGSRR